MVDHRDETIGIVNTRCARRPRRKLPAVAASLLAAASAAAVGCTAGRVTHDGQAVANAAVEVWSCDAVDQYRATTDEGGVYQFNPYSPDSAAFDTGRLIPAGPVAIVVEGSAGGYVARRQHVYDETCAIRHAGATAQRLCKMQHIAMQPMSSARVTSELLAFVRDDCGLEVELPQRFDRDALRAAFARARAAAPGRPSLSDVSQQFSCVADCSASCWGQHPADYTACMCICVEGSCGVPFGPSCVENGVP